MGGGRAKSFLPDSKRVLSPPQVGQDRCPLDAHEGLGPCPCARVAAQAFPHAHRRSSFQSKCYCVSDDDDDDDIISLNCFRAQWVVPGPVPAWHLSLSLETTSPQHLLVYRHTWRRFRGLPEVTRHPAAGAAEPGKEDPQELTDGHASCLLPWLLGPRISEALLSLVTGKQTFFPNLDRS